MHGDDFTSSGPADALDWIEQSLAEHYELTIAPRMGPGPNDAKEGRVLNRVIRWLDGRIEYECDPRQVERLVAECGLDGAKAVSTPGLKPTFKELEEDSAELPSHLTTAFRGAAARGNYLAADRLDAQFACKEMQVDVTTVSTRMEGDEETLPIPSRRTATSVCLRAAGG